MKSARAQALLTGLLFGGPVLVGLLLAAGCGGSSSSGLPGGTTTLAQVTRGQYLVTSIGCPDCHNDGKDAPSDPQWLAGYTSS